MAEIEVAVDLAKNDCVDVEMAKPVIEEEDVAKGLKRKLEETASSEAEVKTNGAVEENGSENGHSTTEEKNGHTNGAAKESPVKKAKTEEDGEAEAEATPTTEGDKESVAAAGIAIVESTTTTNMTESEVAIEIPDDVAEDKVDSSDKSDAVDVVADVAADATAEKAE